MDKLIVEEERQASNAETSAAAAPVPKPKKSSEEGDEEEQEEEQDRDEVRELPRRLCELLRLTGPPTRALFADFDFGEPAPPLPRGTPARSCAAAFLMAWRLALRLVAGAGKGEKAAVDLRPKYSEFLRRGGFLDELMPVLFHLLPSASRKQEVNEEVTTDLSSLASSVYLNLLRHLPALVSTAARVSTYSLSQKSVAKHPAFFFPSVHLSETCLSFSPCRDWRLPSAFFLAPPLLERKVQQFFSFLGARNKNVQFFFPLL